ncbi:MAG TPA: hypothetical protein VF974_05225, partial [Patescibacteria group bacterium]
SILAWTTANATSVSISPTVGTVGLSGSQSVSPTSTTTYTLTATSSSGTATSTVVVTVSSVNPPPPPPGPTPPPTPPPGPGPTPTPPPSVTVRPDMYPAGTIFKYAGNPTVYILGPSRVANPITDWSVYLNQVPASRSIITIPSNITFTQGSVVGLRSGTLIKASNNPTVYLMVNGKKQAFSSAQIFKDHNYNFSNVYSIDDIKLVDNIETTNDPFQRPTGTLFKYASSPAVYFLNSAHLKRGYTTINMFNIWNATLKDVITIPDSETYPDGPIATLPNGIAVKGTSSNIYFVYDGSLRPFNDMSLFTAMGLTQDQIKTFSDSDIALQAMGGVMQ